MKVQIIKTNIFGFGIGYDYKDIELSIHIGVWCLEIIKN
jgi:hypothetical protein